jgi:hypothetical protein
VYDRPDELYSGCEVTDVVLFVVVEASRLVTEPTPADPVAGVVVLGVVTFETRLESVTELSVPVAGLLDDSLIIDDVDFTDEEEPEEEFDRVLYLSRRITGTELFSI